jgi:hypothetical protein
MPKISFFLILCLLFFLYGCGQEHWQTRFEDKIRGEWNIDKITYTYLNPPNSVKTDVGTIRFTDELSIPQFNNTNIACYYQLKDEINNTRSTTYYPMGRKKDSQLSILDFIESEGGDPLVIGDNTYNVEAITNNYVRLASNNAIIELSR